MGDVPGIAAQSPNRAVTVRAQAALDGDDGIGAIVHTIDPVDSLREVPGDLWAANPVDRVEAMLRESRVPIGIVTDGRWWGLVCARENAMVASGVVDALTWTEEPRTRDAFLALIGRQYLIGGDLAERLPVLFEESVAAAEEITEALGAQVRRASYSSSPSPSPRPTRAARLPGPLPRRPHDSYEAAVTVMMRVVFLLFAEERGLLPQGELFDQAGRHRRRTRPAHRPRVGRERGGPRRHLLTWHRSPGDQQRPLPRCDLREPANAAAYGGSLFDPARFLTATSEAGTLGVTVSDRVMLHVLRAVQIAQIRRGASHFVPRHRRRADRLHVRGLLGYTATAKWCSAYSAPAARNPRFPWRSWRNSPPRTMTASVLAKAIREWIGTDQPSAKPSSEAAIAKAIDAAVDPGIVSALTQAVGDDPDLRERVKPWLGLVRLDLRNRPFVVLEGALLVTETPSRKNVERTTRQSRSPKTWSSTHWSRSCTPPVRIKR